MSSSAVLKLGADTLDSTIAGPNTTVVVDFWAPWCGPCRAMEAPFETLAHELEGQVTFAKVDVDAHPELAERFAIRSIPTLLVFSDGALARRVVGAQSMEALRALAGA